MMRRTTCRLLLLACFVVAVGACGDPTQPVVGEDTPEPMQAAIDERCEDPGQSLVDLVAERLDVPADLEHARVVVSEDRDDVRFLAAELVGEQLDSVPPIGTWALVGGEDDPQIFSVDAVARSESTWPDGTRSDHDLTMKIDGGEEAKACVEQHAE